MNLEAERFRGYLWFLAAVMVFISGFETVSELRYILTGENVVGRVTNVREVADLSRRHSEKVLRADYEFADSAGVLVTSHEQLPLDFQIAINDQVSLEHLQGVRNSARMTGRRNWFVIVVFFGSVLLMILGLAWLVREANRPIKRRR